jgi:hypothetical protein
MPLRSSVMFGSVERACGHRAGFREPAALAQGAPLGGLRRGAMCILRSCMMNHQRNQHEFLMCLQHECSEDPLSREIQIFDEGAAIVWHRVTRLRSAPSNAHRLIRGSSDIDKA